MAGKNTKQIAAPNIKGVRRRHKAIAKNINGIKNNSIRKLARRAGIRRICRLLYQDVREAMEKYLRHILRDAMILRDQCNRRTVQLSDVTEALKRRGRPLYI